MGSYHYVLGIDASSSAPLATYINSLLYLLVSTARARSSAVFGTLW